MKFVIALNIDVKNFYVLLFFMKTSLKTFSNLFKIKYILEWKQCMQGQSFTLPFYPTLFYVPFSLT